MQDMKDQLTQLAKDWHEAGRATFEKKFPTLDYDNDRYIQILVIEKREYFYIDEWGSGCFMVEKTTGDIYRIKSYGQINRSKFCGNVETITGEQLHNLRWS